MVAFVFFEKISFPEVLQDPFLDHHPLVDFLSFYCLGPCLGINGQDCSRVFLRKITHEPGKQSMSIGPVQTVKLFPWLGS